jgi:dienelactone hydrolase
VRALSALIVAGAVLAGACGGSETLSVAVTPVEATLDEPLDIEIAGAEASEPVTVTVSGRSFRGRPWRATRTLQADAEGRAVLRDAYLLAQMRPVGGVLEGDYLKPEDGITVDVRDGDDSARTNAKRVVSPPSVNVIELAIRSVGFHARWWTPENDADGPAILLLGGSSGGLAGALKAGPLAGRGYRVLELAYFGLPGLPAELLRIPLEYFRGALEWLRRQKGVDRDRVVVFGVSRGGELALLLGSTFPDLVHSVVAYVPSSSVYPAIVDPDEPAWTLAGAPVPSEAIAVEKISGPIFLVGGDADALWPSGVSVDLIAQRLKENGRRHVVALTYPDAGHAVGVGLPNIRTQTVLESRYGTLGLGGSPEADEAAREDSWPRLLRFLANL